MEERSLDLSAGKLTYFQAGSGRPLLYLHPAGGARRSRVLEGLGQSFSLYVPVIPGSGGAALVAQFVERAIGGRCDVMGWSSGAALALRLALERPELVDHLVLESPGDGKDEALLARAGEIGQTTLIVQGTGDGTISAPGARLLKGALKKAFLVYVWQAGHDLEADQPERVAALVRDFLERSDSFMVNRGNI
jgi:pimeloyl-ACP methyl ester carboxylesterase